MTTQLYLKVGGSYTTKHPRIAGQRRIAWYGAKCPTSTTAGDILANLVSAGPFVLARNSHSSQVDSAEAIPATTTLEELLAEPDPGALTQWAEPGVKLNAVFLIVVHRE